MEKVKHKVGTLFCKRCGDSSYTFEFYCGDRLCESCKEANYSRLLYRYLPAIKKIKPFRLSQITLTFRNVKELTKSTIEKCKEDLLSLRKTKLWLSAVRGGLAVFECKHKSDKTGWNIHIHILVDAGFINYRELSSAWLKITGRSFIVDIRSEGNSVGSIYHLLKYFLKAPVIKGADVNSLELDYNSAFSKFRNLITFGTLFKIKPSKLRFDFVCPECGCTEWVNDFELIKWSFEALEVKLSLG